MDSRELGYLAGIYDGEGCLTFTRWGPTGRPHYRLMVRMNDEDVIQRFKSLGLGTITSYSDKRGNKKLQWSWHVGAGADIIEVIYMFYDIVGERRRKKFDECLADFSNFDQLM